MALGEDEVVVVGQLGVIEVVAQMASGEDGDQVGRGHARGRVPGSGLRARSDPIDPDLLSDLADEIERGKRAGLDTAGDRHWIHLR